MRQSRKLAMRYGAGVLVTMLCLVATFFVVAAKAMAGCGCMDVALVVDDTASMGGVLNNVKAQLPQIIATAQFASGGDLRIGLVTFPQEGVVVNQPLTTDITSVQNAITPLTPIPSGNEPEASDEALQLVVTGAADSSCTVSNAPFGTFRPGCVKIAVLITDAHPGECADTFTAGVSDVHAHSVAVAAANAGILISSIYVPTSGEVSDIKAIMQDYATTSGGVFVETQSNGDGTGDGISDIVASCGVNVTQFATRTSRFWFTHGYSSDTTCVTLLNAILINGSVLNLGFATLPTANRNADNVIDGNDALMEALSFYWKSNGRTGESGGTQSQKLSGSALCKARKQLAVELIAATANIRLLGAKPANATYFNGTTITNFPVDLLSQARTAGAGDDIAAVRSMTALLQKFNKSGVADDFPAGLVECTAQSKKTLLPISRDPTTQDTCPGVNDTCGAAEAVAFPNSGDPFAAAVFKRSVSLSKFADNIQSASCGVGGRDAVWQVRPAVGANGRQFTVATDGSNFDTMISAWSGTCSNLTEVACTNSVLGVRGEHLSFTTDGTNTFYIVVEGPTGQYGTLKVKITSP